MPELTINGHKTTVDADKSTPLLWIIRENLNMTGTSLADATGKQITTIEGLSEHGDHPVQKAWVAEQVPQCGYCQSGQIMQATSLLAHNPAPTRDEIVEAMNGNLCRCMTYPRIVKAIERAANDLRAANETAGRKA
jgi:isoquinoline 1-oxidoreductase alpha subunit